MKARGKQLEQNVGSKEAEENTLKGMKLKVW